eukprot:TRINITY_DN5841_c0_g1_i7.p1 TRINITY_DN5841_c0_g1~~TRINITY_DN5841_c0_g1_i7.p1  ORF type:complete len:543 (+),score=69.58 TRINITY_DN5841_c0_g1_i7:126-1631(+)
MHDYPNYTYHLSPGEEVTFPHRPPIHLRVVLSEEGKLIHHVFTVSDYTFRVTDPLCEGNIRSHKSFKCFFPSGSDLFERMCRSGYTDNEKDFLFPSESWKKYWASMIGVGGVSTALAAAAPSITVAAIQGIGFTSTGIVAGSSAAAMMSSAAIASGGGIAAGSTVATLQSIGAVGALGAGAAAGVVVGALVASILVVGGITVGGMMIYDAAKYKKGCWDFCCQHSSPCSPIYQIQGSSGINAEYGGITVGGMMIYDAAKYKKGCWDFCCQHSSPCSPIYQIQEAKVNLSNFELRRETLRTDVIQLLGHHQLSKILDVLIRAFDNMSAEKHRLILSETTESDLPQCRLFLDRCEKKKHVESLFSKGLASRTQVVALLTDLFDCWFTDFNCFKKSLALYAENGTAKERTDVCESLLGFSSTFLGFQKCYNLKTDLPCDWQTALRNLNIDMGEDNEFLTMLVKYISTWHNNLLDQENGSIISDFLIEWLLHERTFGDPSTLAEQ